MSVKKVVMVSEVAWETYALERGMREALVAVHVSILSPRAVWHEEKGENIRDSHKS
jgi:hypothetical protein